MTIYLYGMFKALCMEVIETADKTDIKLLPPVPVRATCRYSQSGFSQLPATNRGKPGDT